MIWAEWLTDVTVTIYLCFWRPSTFIIIWYFIIIFRLFWGLYFDLHNFHTNENKSLICDLFECKRPFGLYKPSLHSPLLPFRFFFYADCRCYCNNVFLVMFCVFFYLWADSGKLHDRKKINAVKFKSKPTFLKM